MCTARDGVSSSAGIQAIETYLQCGKISAERYVRALVEAGVIIDLRSGLGGEKAMRATVRFKLRDYSETIGSRVWFDRSIVEFVDRKTNETNILKLCRERPECIRILLWLYTHMPAGATTVQHPLPSLVEPGVFIRYEWDEDYTLKTDTHTFQVACHPSFSLEDCDLSMFYGEIKLERAVWTLQRKGFLYEVVMVWDQPLTPLPESTGGELYIEIGSQPLYQLHVRKCGGKLSGDEVGVSNLTLKAASCADIQLFEHDGVIDNKFVVISKPESPVGVAGVLRLSHRVKNSKNLGVKDAWAALMDTERDYRQWLGFMLDDEYGIAVSAFQQSIRFEAKCGEVAARRASTLRTYP